MSRCRRTLHGVRIAVSLDFNSPNDSRELVNATNWTQQAYVEIQHGRRCIWLASTGASTTPARNSSQKWRKFKQKWSNYEIATGVAKKDKPTRVAILLTVIGEDAVNVYNTLTWDELRGRRTQNWKSFGEVGVVLQPEEEHNIRTLCFFLKRVESPSTTTWLFYKT